MSAESSFLALDLGAESGRGIVGTIDGGRLDLEVIHRFPNGPVTVMGSLHWDVLGLYREMLRSISLAADRGRLAGIGLDTWGVDYALLDTCGKLLGNPYHYRDARTEGMMDEANRRVPAEEIYERTGIQLMRINTLYQLLAASIAKCPMLESAGTLLPIANLFGYWLSGAKVAEFTYATTTQLYDPRAGDWAWGLIDKFGLPARIFPEVVQPGTVHGPILRAVAEETGAGDVPLIETACHDTGSAVTAVPAEVENYAYISSGTWSLMGVELRQPVINEAARKANFTNEGGVDGTFRFLKNIGGLWLVQESRRTWAKQGIELSYDQLADMAADARPFKCIIDPDHAPFLVPGDVPARIVDYCKKTGQAAPETRGEVVRTALEGLALRYRYTLDLLQSITGRRPEIIHIVGGGSQNKLLCQFAADATGLPVVAGPVEATAAGNVLVQAMATGLVGSLTEARRIVRNSFDLARYEPGDDDIWNEAYGRFRKLIDS